MMFSYLNLRMDLGSDQNSSRLFNGLNYFPHFCNGWQM